MSVTTHAMPSCIIIQIHSTLKAIKDYIPIYLKLNFKLYFEEEEKKTFPKRNEVHIIQTFSSNIDEKKLKMVK